MSTASQKARTAVVICNCGGTLFDAESAESMRARLGFADDDTTILPVDAACSGEGRSSISKLVSKHQIDRLVLAGCSPTTNGETVAAIASATGLHASHIVSANIRETVFLPPDGRGITGLENRIEAATSMIRRGVRTAEAIGDIETATYPVVQRALVVGDGVCARTAAAGLSGLGTPVTLVTTEEGEHEGVDPETVDLRTGWTVERVEGYVGSFRTTISSAGGNGSGNATTIETGAVVLAFDPWHSADERLDSSENVAPLVSVDRLAQAFDSLPRIPRTRIVAIVLDRDVDETKASTERACETALRLQKDSVCQVHVLCRDVRVASLGLESLYDEARDAGVNFVKYSKRLSISGDENGVRIDTTDEVLGERIRLQCDLVGVSSQGVALDTNGPRPEAARIADMLRIDLDELGYVQANNVNLLPVETNVPGVFVAAGARGQHSMPQAVEESRDAALEAHALLAEPEMTVELSGAQVDPETCAICLTCIRVCPHRAMQIDRENNIAQNIPQACRKCGICVGECPAGAITLPAYTEQSIFAWLG